MYPYARRKYFRACTLISLCEIQVTNIGTLTPTRGFSSFKFLPGSNEKIIIALKSEEYQGRMSTYIVAFTTDGNILMPEMKVANEKFEGFEFI